MTKERWLEKVKESQVKLAGLISEYHPAARSKVRDREMANRVADSMPITAPTAERACRNVREKIAGEYKTDPLMDFDNAIKAEDISAIYSILSGAWFGVPESTSCWKIPGFREAVDLMDDPPDPEPNGGDLVHGDADRDEGGHGPN